MLDAYAEALEARSLDQAEKSVQADGFTTIESGYANWTWEDFKNSHLGVELEAFSDIDYDMDLISGKMQGQMGYAIYQFSAAGKMNGEARSTTGYGTAILEQTDAGLRIQHIHSSTPGGAH